MIKRSEKPCKALCGESVSTEGSDIFVELTEIPKVQKQFDFVKKHVSDMIGYCYARSSDTHTSNADSQSFRDKRDAYIHMLEYMDDVERGAYNV